MPYFPKKQIIVTLGDTGGPAGPMGPVGPVGPTGSGENIPSIQEFAFSAGVFSTNSTASPKRVGGRSIDLSMLPIMIGTFTRHVVFTCSIESSDSSITASCRLYDVSSQIYVNNTVLDNSMASDRTVTSLLSTSNLQVGNIPGFLRDDAVHQYEAQLWMTDGSVTDRVTCTDARLIVSYF